MVCESQLIRVYKRFIYFGCILLVTSNLLLAQEVGVVPMNDDLTSQAQLSLTKLDEIPSASTNERTQLRRIQVEGAMLKTIDSTTLSAQVAGVLSESNLREGALVHKGQTLATIHDASTRLKLEQLKLKLEIARQKKVNTIDKEVASKSSQVAETEYQRALAANKRVPNTYPLNEIDRLKLVAERSRLEEQRADYNMEMAALEADVTSSECAQTEELLLRHSITTPVDGMIVAVEKKLGEWVEPGTEVFRIVRTDTLRIEGLIPAAADDGFLVGRSAIIHLIRTKNSNPFSGKVVFVSPDVNPINSLVRVFIEVENPDRSLRPGLPVHADILLESPIAQDAAP